MEFKIFILTTDNHFNDRWAQERFKITQVYAKSRIAAMRYQSYLNLVESGNEGIVTYIGEEETCMPLEWDNQISN
jgi:hypothetical protein